MLRNIQYLRGIAALLVTIGHNLQLIRDKVYASDSAVVSHFENSGAVGVDVFFVISGFIMFFISGNEAQSFRATLVFWGKRICRVMPTYWIFTSIVLAFYLTGIPKSKIDFGSHYLLGSYLLLPVSNLDGRMLPVLNVGWTLIYEMFFYFLFGWLLLARTTVRVMALSGLMLALVIAGYCLPELGARSVLFFTYSSPMLLEFLFGIWIAKAYLSGWRLPPGIALVLVSLGFVLLSCFYQGVESTRPFISGIPAAAIVIGAMMLEPLNQGTSRLHTPLKRLGDASYSLYLIHPVMLFGISFAVRHLPTGTVGSAIWVFVLTTALQIGAALIFFKWVEKPLTDALHRRFFSRKTRI